jgi:DNA replication protein DnaC
MGYKVSYASTSKLMGQIKLSKAKDTNITDLKRIERTDLLILDDFGLHGYQSKNWYDVIREKIIAGAVLDRIVHQSIRFELHGESFRRKNFPRGQFRLANGETLSLLFPV